MMHLGTFSKDFNAAVIQPPALMRLLVVLTRA